MDTLTVLLSSPQIDVSPSAQATKRQNKYRKRVEATAKAAQEG
jgi:hypothetical protein